MRDVEKISEDIADEHKSASYVLSKSWVAALESGKGHMPSLARLYSLGAIYKRSVRDLAQIFDVPLQDLGKDQASYGVPKTSLVAEGNDDGEVVTLPLRFRNDPEVQNTNLLHTLAAVWGSIPFSLARLLRPEQKLYGFIGLSDRTLSPLLRPGTFVEIDVTQCRVQPAPPQSEG
ncbi:MAG: hypothetical protein JO260_07160, partial [Acidobacteria bacterium]|nr:hypothetical protein [Acidobacteriota bacterium]